MDDSQQVINIIDKLLSLQTVLTIRIEGEKTVYTSKVLKINLGQVSSEGGQGAEFIIDKVTPETGNALIQTYPEVTLEFPFDDSYCRCLVKFSGISNEDPFYGIILSFPESIDFIEQRREKRHVYDVPEMVSVEFRLEKGPDKVYSLNVFDSSRHGLGILVTEADSALMEILELGDEIKDITYYATSAMIKVDGIVRHKTPIKEGKYEGCYILGIESPDIIESYK